MLISTSTQSDTVCGFYVSPSGNFTWSTSGTYYDLLPSSAGCDSILTINLTVQPSPVVVVTASGPTSFCQGDSVVLSASTPLSGWQWVRSGMELISQSNPTFKAWATGNYLLRQRVFRMSIGVIGGQIPSNKKSMEYSTYWSILDSPSHTNKSNSICKLMSMARFTLRSTRLFQQRCMQPLPLF